MKHNYIRTDIDSKNKQYLYNSRFDRIFTEISNHYQRTQEDTTAASVALPTIIKKPIRVLARYESPEPPVGKIFKHVYKDNISLRDKINSIKYATDRTKISLEEYHTKIVK